MSYRRLLNGSHTHAAFPSWTAMPMRNALALSVAVVILWATSLRNIQSVNSFQCYCRPTVNTYERGKYFSTSGCSQQHLLGPFSIPGGAFVYFFISPDATRGCQLLYLVPSE